MLRPRPLAWNGVKRGVTTGVEGVTTGVEDVWYDVSYGMKDAGHDVTCGGAITER